MDARTCGLLITLFSTLYLVSSEDIIVTPKECGRTKTCLHPAGCSDNQCAYFASWKKVSTNGEKYIEFELEGHVMSLEGYIGIVLSKDKKEGDDAIIACYHDNSNQKVGLLAAYALPDKTSADEDFNSIIKETELPKGYLVFSDEKTKLLGGTFSGLTRYLQCRFRRQVTPNSKVDVLKDLTKFTPVNVRVIRGPTIYPGMRLARPFGGAYAPAPDNIDINAMPVASTRAERSSLAKTHGCFMVLAWVLCSSIAIFMARYYKSMWPNNRFRDERAWFYVHSTLQTTCVILTIIGVILIFIHAGGYAYYDDLPQRAHPILGLIVFILAMINPLLALCRCAPDHRDRPIFNWFHFIIGTIAHVLSIPTIMIGFRMPDSGSTLPQMDLPLWILIFYIIFQLILEIMLEIHGCIYYRKNKTKRQEYEADLRAYHSKLGPKVTPREPEPSGRTFKTVVLGLYCTVTAAVAFALIILIAVY